MIALCNRFLGRPTRVTGDSHRPPSRCSITALMRAELPQRKSATSPENVRRQPNSAAPAAVNSGNQTSKSCRADTDARRNRWTSLGRNRAATARSGRPTMNAVTTGMPVSGAESVVITTHHHPRGDATCLVTALIEQRDQVAFRTRPHALAALQTGRQSLQLSACQAGPSVHEG